MWKGFFLNPLTIQFQFSLCSEQAGPVMVGYESFYCNKLSTSSLLIILNKFKKFCSTNELLFVVNLIYLYFRFYAKDSAGSYKCASANNAWKV